MAHRAATAVRPTPAWVRAHHSLVLPVGVTTRVNLVSNDVVHGFYIPAFNFSRYAQPGVT